MNLTIRVEFSPREREVAELIADGETYAQIGKSLRMSPHTVRAYVNRMADKIDQQLTDNTKALEPRNAVFMVIQHERWSRQWAG